MGKNVSSLVAFTALACIAVYILMAVYTLTFAKFEIYTINTTTIIEIVNTTTTCSNNSKKSLLEQSEDLLKFNNTAIRTVFRTPGFRFFDDKLVSVQNNIYLEKYKLHFCKIDKNMGTSMQAILCFIDDQREHGDLFHNQSWYAGVGGTPCGYSTEHGTPEVTTLRGRFLKAAEDFHFFDEESKIYHFSIIRNPLSRFISAFIDICVNRAPVDTTTCFSCGSDLDCFVPKLHEFLYKQSEHLYTRRWLLDWHFFPQSWYCSYDRHIDKYHFFHYDRSEEFWEQLVQVFRNSSVEPNLISVIEQKLKNMTAIHATFSKSGEFNKKIRESPVLLEYLYKMYFLDFVWFDYRL